MPALDPLLLDLRTHQRSDLLAAFIELYTHTFTDASEREDPTQWLPRLSAELAAPQPQLHLVVAVAADTTLLGGIVFEYYRGSRCGLLTYLVVDPTYRRHGLARQLVQHALAQLKQAASDEGAQLRAVFSETEDPDQVQAQNSVIAPHERLSVLARLGARRIAIPYVQPTLEGGSGRCRHLLLLAFYPDYETIEAVVVQEFLHEFYRALGVARPELDQDFLAMDSHLHGRLILKPL